MGRTSTRTRSGGTLRMFGQHIIDESLISCGVMELYNLSSDSEEIVKSVCRDFQVPFFLFSDLVFKKKRSSGQLLVTYIRRKKLGDVTSQRSAINPNSGNRINVWVWRPDYKRMKQLFGEVE